MHDEVPLGERLVFVVGAPRSGTTWVQRVIAAHPDAVGLPSETHLFSVTMSVVRDRVQGGLLDSTGTATWFMPHEEFVAAARDFCDAALGSWVRRRAPDALRVVERTPSHVWHLGLIGAVYPEATVVHVVRDGRDVARSLVSASWGPADVRGAARLWASSVRAARAAAPAVGSYHEVRYEDLLADVRRLPGLHDAVGLPRLPGSDHLAELEGGLAVNVDPTRPDVATGKWRHEWSAAERTAYDEEVGDLAAEHGPAQDGAAGAPPAPPPGRSPPRGPRLLVRGVRRRVRGLRGPAPGTPGARGSAPALVAGVAGPTGDGRTWRAPAERSQESVVALLEALARADVDALRPLLDVERLRVRYRDGPVRLDSSGGEGLSALADHLVADGPWGDQLHGEQVVGGRSWTLLLAHRRDGQVVDRVVVASLGPDQRVRELTVTRLPLEHPSR